MMKHVSETSEKQLGNGRIFTFGTVSIWYNPERSFRRFARILNNRSVITEQVFRKESRNTALSDDLIQPFSTKTRRYIDMLSTHKTITLALMCALASTTVLTGCKDGAQQGQAAQRQMPPTEVTYVTAKTTDQTLQTTLTGRTSAYYEAEVRPQVNGVLVKKLFKDGSEVKAGQQLYQIDDAPYVAALKSAEASLAQANANLVKARADAKRSSELVKINAVSKQSDDAAQAALKSAVANQKAAEAAVATAKVNMQYTKVLSPISGRISRSEFTEGALMAAYQATPLTRVQQLDPIYVDVTQKADDLMRIRRDIASGVLKSGDNQSARVQLVFDDGSVYPHEGELTFTDVTVNESTGMVNVRAVFPNPDKVLLPGLYVRANLVEGVRPDSIVIPMQCVMRDAKGNASVWVIDAENKIATRKITASRSIGTSWLVESGLKAGDRVVFEGFQRTRAGATVSPKKADASKMLDKTGKSLY